MIHFKEVLRDLLDQYPVVKRTAERLIATVPLSIRLGKRFWYWYAFLEESEQWSMSEMSQYQMNRLRTLLGELVQVSQFYRERLAGVDIQSLDTLQEFQTQVPALSRKQFRENYSNILSSSWEQQRVARSQTSGTTGTALQFYHLRRDSAREWAAICHQWKRVGYVPGKSQRAEFRGLTRHGELVEIFPHQKMIRCSILHLRSEHIRYYADQIAKYGIDFYHGYPSAFALLAREICQIGIPFPEPKVILLASEVVYEWQLAQIRQAFPNAKLFAHYGCAERTVLAGWCEHRQEYHVLPQYALVQVDKTTSEIIGTNLYNTVNGFVRYRMTDAALQVEHQPCPDCGRSYVPRLLQLGGRKEDYLYSPQRGWIPPAIITYPLKSLHAIRELQFLQKEKDEVIIRYTVQTRANAASIKADLEQIQVGMYRLCGSETKFCYERVDDFPRGPTGKFKWVICELDEIHTLGI